MVVHIVEKLELLNVSYKVGMWARLNGSTN